MSDSSRLMKATVVSVNISTEKGTVKAPVDQVLINENGIVDDAHAGPWHRQISLLSSEDIARFGTVHVKEFSFGDFAENITTAGLDLKQLAILDRLILGDVELEVTQIGKKCHGGGCAIFQAVGKCVMPKEGIFCRVIQGGTLAAGGEILHKERPLRVRTITLSDRASAGVYEDRSGPRIHQLLEDHFEGSRWHLQTDAVIIPDDETRLLVELDRAVADGVDFLFTTGGTGIGPRDITPDVVTARLDREIPGIMEFIRCKYGAEKPVAQLSRSVAGLMGQTFVYTLPGSVRAVNEYLAEITTTLEHLLLMHHEIDAH
jgi:molybdopterin adenylyltransferase